MRGSNKCGKSGYFGVTWHKCAKKWSVQARIKGKVTYIGLFTDIVKAAEAFDKVSYKQHKKNGNLNFPENYK